MSTVPVLHHMLKGEATAFDAELVALVWGLEICCMDVTPGAKFKNHMLRFMGSNLLHPTLASTVTMYHRIARLERRH